MTESVRDLDEHAKKIAPDARYIGSLTGLKVLATLGIFCWHTFPNGGMPDLGARLCELFFVCSGFLIGYNRHGRLATDVQGACRYVWGKVVRFYPVYVVAFLIAALRYALGGGLSQADALSAVWHLALLQAWIPAIALDWNGAAWFLSALLFCYACAPLMQLAVARAEAAFGKRRGCAALFLIVFVARVFLELCALSGYPLSSHCSPVIRALEFFLAYIAGSQFLSFQMALPAMQKHARAAVFTGVELAAIIAYVGCVMRFDTIWSRWTYVLMALLLVSALALNAGYVSRILSCRALRACSRIELEFYLLHQPVVRLLAFLFALWSLGGYKKVALASLAVTAALSIACRYAYMRCTRRKGERYGRAAY